MHLSHNSHGVHDDTLIIHGVEALEVNISGLRINIDDGDVGAEVVRQAGGLEEGVLVEAELHVRGAGKHLERCPRPPE